MSSKLLEIQLQREAKDSESSEEEGKSKDDKPCYCLICEQDGEVEETEGCVWQAHVKAYEKEIFSILGPSFPFRNVKKQAQFYRQVRYNSHEFLYRLLNDDSSHENCLMEEALPPCIELRLKYWFSSYRQAFKKY